MPIPLIDELVSHPVRAYRNGSLAWISDLKIVLIPCFTFLKYNSFELWSAWYSNNTNKWLVEKFQDATDKSLSDLCKWNFALGLKDTAN